MTLNVAFLVDFDGHPVFDSVYVIQSKKDLFQFLADNYFHRYCYICLPYDQDDWVAAPDFDVLAKRLIKKVFK